MQWHSGNTDAQNQKKEELQKKKNPHFSDLFLVTAALTPPR
jgi:hypothetical protein